MEEDWYVVESSPTPNARVLAEAEEHMVAGGTRRAGAPLRHFWTVWNGVKTLVIVGKVGVFFVVYWRFGIPVAVLYSAM